MSKTHLIRQTAPSGEYVILACRPHETAELTNRIIHTHPAYISKGMRLWAATRNLKEVTCVTCLLAHK